MYPSFRLDYAERIDLQPLGHPELKLSERGLRISRVPPLLPSDDERNYRERCSSERNHYTDSIVSPADRTDICSGENCARHNEIIDHLETAIDPCLVPALEVIKSSDEKLRVVL